MVRAVHSKSPTQRGYILVSVMLLMTLMLLVLSIEAPRITQQIKREKEEELIHRGNEYKNAIRKFFRKFGRYPMTVEQLENTNNMRFLRKRYKDPFTGKDDWRLLHPGEVQLNPLNKGASAPGQPIGQSAGSGFGQQPGLFGSNAPNTEQQQSGFTQGVSGGATAPGFSSNATGGTGFMGTPANQPNNSAIGTSPGQTNTTGLMSTNSPGQFGGGPIIGVSSTNKSKSIKEINGKDHYNEWYFVYDPRLEQQTLPPGAPGGAGSNPIGGSGPQGFNPPSPTGGMGTQMGGTAPQTNPH